MSNIVDNLRLTAIAQSINVQYPDPNRFREWLVTLNESERKTLLRHYYVSNTPYIFKEHALITEQINQFFVDQLHIEPIQLFIIGSGKIGFSSKVTEYGRRFSEKSDLDFTLVNETIFDKLAEDFNVFQKYYSRKEMCPRSDVEEKYWRENLQVVPKNIGRGFIDTKKIPNRQECPTAGLINNLCWKIKSTLKMLYGIEIRGASMRVYRDYRSFEHQFFINYSSIVKDLKAGAAQ